MAVEVYKSSGGGSTSGDMDLECFELASFFSASSHFTVIDSYTSHYFTNRLTSPPDPPSYIPKRYKGDPIADDDPARPGFKVWHDVLDCGENNDWIIVECITTIHTGLGLPNWQCKIQFCAAGNPFADPSDPTGAAYPKNHGVNPIVCVRLGPYGGWNLADVTPDFTPVGVPLAPSTENHWQRLRDSSANAFRWYMVCDDGGFCRFGRRHLNAYELDCFGGYVGDLRSIDSGISIQPMPRILLGSGGITSLPLYQQGNNRMMCDGSYVSNTASNDYSVNDSYGGIAFWDDAEALIQETYKIPSDGVLINEGETQPNPYLVAGEYDLFPYMPMPVTRTGLIGSIPLIRKGYGVGRILINGGDWLSTGDGHCIFIKWDGSTTLY